MSSMLPFMKIKFSQFSAVRLDRFALNTSDAVLKSLLTAGGAWKRSIVLEKQVDPDFSLVLRKHFWAYRITVIPNAKIKLR